MGSGSGGGGGGGSGGASGGGGGGQGYGGYRISGGRILVQDVDVTKKADAVIRVLKKLRPEYLHEQFVDSSAREVYRALVLLNGYLAINRNWAGIAAMFKVDGGSGCLPRLAAALMRRFETADRNKKSRAFVRMALENFLLRAVGDDSQTFAMGSAEGVIEHLDAGVFERLSALFLGDLLYEVIRGEERALPPEVKNGLRSVVQGKADRIVDDFITRFGGKSLGDDIKQISYRHLFDVIAQREDWFLDQLRA
jgi:hypothetical protein